MGLPYIPIFFEALQTPTGPIQRPIVRIQEIGKRPWLGSCSDFRVAIINSQEASEIAVCSA